MAGRNEPCPCGSGKKYKKCCESKLAVSVEAVQAEELERVLQTFYDEYPERKDIPEYIELAKEWKESLLAFLPEEMIEAIALDEFFFHYRQDIWQTYVKRQLKKQMRPSVQTALNMWLQPEAFIGEVMEDSGTHVKVNRIINGEPILLKRVNDKPISIGAHLYCFILPDGTGEEGHYLAVSTLIFFPTDFRGSIESFSSRFPGENEMPISAYFKEKAVDFWVTLGKDGYEGGEYTNFEAGVLIDIMHFLENHSRSADKLLGLVEDFLVEQQPNARKEAAIAAGAIRFGQERSLIEPLPMTLKEIADSFGVSTSSMNKYAKELDAYYSQLAG